MSRLDQHVSAVQNKLALSRFIDALAKTLFIFAIGVLVTVLVNKVFRFSFPRQLFWMGSGFGAAALAAIIFAIVRRPAPHDAAVAIDDVLNIKEKFATALHVRNWRDEFAQAAVRDAERTANDVDLHKK